MAEAKQPQDAQDEIARLLAAQIKIAVGGQADAIRELSRVGIGNTRIGELLGTSAATVKVTLQRDRKNATKSGKVANEGERRVG